jgi:mRNA interferase MazF
VTAPIRGQVFMVDVPELGEEKPFLVVSNNARNRNLDTVVCVRVSTSPNRPAHIPSIVPIDDRGAVVGQVLCDDVLTVRRSRLKRMVGALPARIMTEVNAGLRSALDCEPD